jgi:methylated-DNA-[protein]-cysteine S-methyltransferase
MISQITFNTKVGWVSAFENEGKIFKVKFGRLRKQKKSKVLKKFRKNLLQFFNKKTSNIKIPHKIKGNQIQKKIWSELKKIKMGQTKSYGQIAKKYKLSPRHIGKICSQNTLLLLVPCHRVIRTDGTLGGFTSVGGIKLKRKLLEFEKS